MPDAGRPWQGARPAGRRRPTAPIAVLNGADFAPGPFAPNFFVAIFGTDLPYYTARLRQGTNMMALPYEVGNVRVCVNNVCATQINLLVPGNLKPGAMPVYVVRQGLRGSDATVTLVPATPQLFTIDNRQSRNMRITP